MTISNGELDEVEYLDDVNTKDWDDKNLAGYSTAGWYFWREDFVYMTGPFESKDIASNKLEEYYSNLKKKEDNNE